MPWEIIADFRPALGATEEDGLWTKLALGFTKGLVELEPRLRCRIRNLPPGVLRDRVRSFEEFTSAAGFDMSDPAATRRARALYDESRRQQGATSVVEQPVALISDDVPAILQARIEIPKAGTFWVRNYYCQECMDQKTGKPGVWIPHIRRKLHMRGQPLVFLSADARRGDGPPPVHSVQPRKGDVRMKGIRNTWVPTHQAIVASPSRLHACRALTALRYSVAVTGVPADPAMLDGFHTVLIVPLKAGPDYAAVAQRIRSALPECESVAVLPRKPSDAIRAILAALMDSDSVALEDPRDDDAADAADVMLRVTDARSSLLADAGSIEAASAMKAALDDLVAAVPERAREAALEAAKLGSPDPNLPPAQWLALLDAAVERVAGLVDPETQQQIARDRAARSAVGGMVEKKRAQLDATKAAPGAKSAAEIGTDAPKPESTTQGEPS